MKRYDVVRDLMNESDEFAAVFSLPDNCCCCQLILATELQYIEALIQLIPGINKGILFCFNLFIANANDVWSALWQIGK